MKEKDRKEVKEKRRWGDNVIVDLMSIYTWTELWLVVSVPTAIFGFWLFFSYLLNIPNDAVRTIAIWASIFTLTAGAATVDYLRKRR